MLEVKGNIWDFYDKGETICITTNKIVKKSNCALVMGKGLALEAKNRFPGIEIDWGRAVLFSGGKTCYFPLQRLIMFPTKDHWKNPSTIELIRQSFWELTQLMDSYKLGKVYLPKVGCGNGGLSWEEDVLPRIKQLDDRFIFVSE